MKVSNVPSVFVPPEYINLPADYRPDTEAAAPPADRQRLQGSTDVAVPHLYDASLPPITVPISNDDLQFQLRPGYLLPPGSSSASAAVVYLNAQDTSFYRQLLPSPRFTLWVVIKNTSFILNTSNNVGYVKRRLVEECLRVNVQCLLLNPNDFDLAVSRSGVSSVVYRGQQIPLPAAVIPRVGANVDYFGLAVLRQLEALGVRVFNPVNAIEISRDKLYTHQVLSSNGLPIPRTCLSRFPFEFEYIERHFSYPFIVKLASGSRGEAVWKVEDRDEVARLMETVDRSKPIIVQEFVAATSGRDLRCLVVGDAVVASCMRLSSSSSFKANYHAGGSTLPIAISAGLQAMVVKASQLCGLSFSGVDVLLGSDGYLLCEVNSSPGFEGLERATGVNCGKAMLDWAEREVLDKTRQQQTQQTRPDGWRLREKEYPLQDDHMRIIRQVQQQEREAAEQEESRQAAAAAAAAAGRRQQGRPLRLCALTGINRRI